MNIGGRRQLVPERLFEQRDSRSTVTVEVPAVRLVERWFHIARHGCLVFLQVALGMLLMAGIASPVFAQVVTSSPAWMHPDPSAGFFLPENLFSKRAVGAPAASHVASQASRVLPLPNLSGDAGFLLPSTWQPLVYLYTSPATQAYFASGGLDAKANQRVWETLLRKYGTPFKLINSVAQLEVLASGVLLMPSAVVLTPREKQAVLSFRAKGGSILTSWLTGVRGESGAWLGFDFMEQALDVKVVGTTQDDEKDIYLMPHGDSPVTYRLPAGQRIWTERAKEWYPLRLVGHNPVAYMLDWSRKYVSPKAASVVFDERRQQTGAMSRSVVLGYPERLWLGSDRKQLDALAHDALEWLLHRPSAHVAAWPYPYTSAFVLAVDVTDIIDGKDLNIAKLYEDIGGRATYYTVGELAPASAFLLKKLQDRGHELGYLGDTFNGFKGQPLAMQAKRLDAVRKDFKDSGLSFAADAGFRPPSDSLDKTTERLLVERQFGHYIAFMGATDARLPFLVMSDPSAEPLVKSTVALPRTQIGLDEAMEGNDPKNAVPIFLGELELASKMAGLSVGKVINPSLLTPQQWAEIIQFLKERRDRMWLATSGQVADWWRERDRVTINLDSLPTTLQLSITVKGSAPLQQAVTVLINMPESGGTLRAQPNDKDGPSVKIETVDDWRSAVVLTDLSPGKHAWLLHFDPPRAK